MGKTDVTTGKWTTGKLPMFLVLIFLGAGVLCGCASQKAWKGAFPDTGPTVKLKSLPETASADTKKLVEQLYGDASEAANAAVLLGRNKEREAVPFLVSMLGDTRLVKLREPLFEEYKPTYPVGYVAARSLGLLGESSVVPVIEWLKDNHAYFYLRGNAAAALSFSINDDRNTSDLLKKLQGTGHAKTLINALESCANMSANPMLLPAIANNPNYSLSTGNRGGILTFIRIAGMMEDPRALPSLYKIAKDSEFTDLERSRGREAISLIEAKKGSGS